MNFPKNIVNSQALFNALVRQVEPLPESLQRSLTEIGLAWQANPNEENAKILRQTIRSNASFEAAYQSAIVDLRRKYVSQERTKDLSETFLTEATLDDIFFGDILFSEDWVSTAKQLIESITNPIRKLEIKQVTEDSIFGNISAAFHKWQSRSDDHAVRSPTTAEVFIESNVSAISIAEIDEGIESPAESFRQGWADVVAGKTSPASQLWD
jgi:hypothetical protein